MTVEVATLRARLERNADLLMKATRERARAYAELGAARAELRELRLELSAARELLAYFGLTPIDEEER